MSNPIARPRGRAAALPALIAALAVTAAPAGATTDAALAACADITDNASRLACYDRLGGRLAAPSASAATAQPVPSPAAPLTAPSAPTAAAEAAPATPAAEPAVRPASMIDATWGFDPDSTRYLIALYRPTYVLPARWSSNPNDRPFSPIFAAAEDGDGELDSVEAKFQLSFKARLWTTDDRRFGVWVGYTQQNQWQVYNGELSRPFRETNYMPEVFMSFRPGLSLAGFHWRLFNFGYLHQSNGRADPISRSWDRLVAEFGIERGNFALLLRPWVRIDSSGGGDDNPDITDYYGNGELTALYRWRGHSFTLSGRGDLADWKGAAQLTWMSPPFLGPLRAYVQGFTGYGESLIDYNWKQNTIGIGLALNDLLEPAPVQP